MLIASRCGILCVDAGRSNTLHLLTKSYIILQNMTYSQPFTNYQNLDGSVNTHMMTDGDFLLWESRTN